MTIFFELYFLFKAFETDDTSEVGQTPWGRWQNYIQCPSRKRLKGFKLQIDWTNADVTALNGMQFKCEKLYPSEKVKNFTFGEIHRHTQCRFSLTRT